MARAFLDLAVVNFCHSLVIPSKILPKAVFLSSTVEKLRAPKMRDGGIAGKDQPMCSSFLCSFSN